MMRINLIRWGVCLAAIFLQIICPSLLEVFLPLLEQICSANTGNCILMEYFRCSGQIKRSAPLLLNTPWEDVVD